MNTTVRQIQTWGNSFGLRITQRMAKSSGLSNGSPVRVTVSPGRIVIASCNRPSLKDKLAMFAPQKHGGEVIADMPRGVEKIS